MRDEVPSSAMTETEVIWIMRGHLNQHFPKVCRMCHRCFESPREFLQNTTQLGPPMLYDVELGEWQPLQPLGAMTFANCQCGNTLSLSSEGMPRILYWRLLGWAQCETKRRGLSPQELMVYLRDEICRQVLAEVDQQASGQAG